MIANIFTLLQANYAGLTKVEKILADRLLEDPHSFINLTMAELAEACGVAQGSINNFAKKLTGSGYTALKLQVAHSLPEHKEKQLLTPHKLDGVTGSSHQIMQTNQLLFDTTMQLNPEPILRQVAELLLNARRIELHGAYQSAIVARDFCLQLIELGLHATYMEDSFTGALTTTTLDKQDLVFAVSKGGRTQAVADILRLAKRKGVPTVALTAYKTSPIARLADIVLLVPPCHSDHLYDTNRRVRTAQTFLVDTLCSYLYNLPNNELHRRSESAMHEILNFQMLPD